MTLFQLSYALLWSLAIALIPVSVVLLYTLAQLQVQIRTEGAGFGNNLIGRQLPLSSARDFSGATVDIQVFRGEVHVILLVSPTCGTCRSLIAELTNNELSDVRLMLLLMGDFDQCKAAVGKPPSLAVLFQDVKDDTTFDLWHAGFPTALIVDEAGIIADVRHPLTSKGLLTIVESTHP